MLKLRNIYLELTIVVKCGTILASLIFDLLWFHVRTYFWRWLIIGSLLSSLLAHQIYIGGPKEPQESSVAVVVVSGMVAYQIQHDEINPFFIIVIIIIKNVRSVWLKK